MCRRGNGRWVLDKVRSPIRLGIIPSGQCRCGQVAKQIRRVWHCSPSIAARDKYGTDRMHEARLKGAGAPIVVARILVKQRGEERIRQEVAAAPVDKRCRITLAISRSTLPEPGLGVRRLFDAGAEAAADADNGTATAPCRLR